MKKEFRFRTIDRVVFHSLAALQVFSGAYLISPAYLNFSDEGRSPLYYLFQSDAAIKIFGIALLIDGLTLFLAALKEVQKAWLVSWAVLAGFLLRLFSLIGVFLTIESWRPPSYLSHAFTVVVLAGYWIWVKRNERFTQ